MQILTLTFVTPLNKQNPIIDIPICQNWGSSHRKKQMGFNYVLASNTVERFWKSSLVTKEIQQGSSYVWLLMPTMFSQDRYSIAPSPV